MTYFPKMFFIESVKSHTGMGNPVLYFHADRYFRHICPDRDAMPMVPKSSESVVGETWVFPDGTRHVIGITEMAKKQLGPLYELHKGFARESAFLRGRIVSLESNVDYYRTQVKKLETLGFWKRVWLLFAGWSMEEL